MAVHPQTSSEIDNGNRRYIAATMQIDLLEREHEFALARRWRDQRDQAALHELVSAYARFVVRIAWGFRGYGLPVGDLVQEGNVGLMEAAARFDPERNARFSTYAAWWIVAAIQDFVLRHTSIVRVATTPAQRRLFFNLRRARARYATGANGTLTDADREQVAAVLGVSSADVQRMETHLSAPDASLNGGLGHDEGGDELQDFLADDRPSPEETLLDANERDYNARRLREALAQLSPRERRIIDRRFLSEERATLSEIGEDLGVSKERIRQIEAKALDKLRATLKGLSEATLAPVAVA